MVGVCGCMQQGSRGHSPTAQVMFYFTFLISADVCCMLWQARDAHILCQWYGTGHNYDVFKQARQMSLLGLQAQGPSSLARRQHPFLCIFGTQTGRPALSRERSLHQGIAPPAFMAMSKTQTKEARCSCDMNNSHVTWHTAE